MEYYHGRSMMDGGSYGGVWAIFMMILCVALLVIIGIVIVRVLRYYGADTQPKVDHLDTIKGRYAKGEITKEQFEQLKKDLK